MNLSLYILQLLRLAKSLHNDLEIQSKLLKDAPSSYIHPTTSFYLSDNAQLALTGKVRIGKNNLVIVDSNQPLPLHDHTTSPSNARLIIEDDVYINECNNIRVSGESLTIRKGARISQYVNIICSNYASASYEGYQRWITKGPMIIGAYSFLGAGCTILPGVSVGKHSIVAAGAVVTKSVPDFSICAGVPASILQV